MLRFMDSRKSCSFIIRWQLPVLFSMALNGTHTTAGKDLITAIHSSQAKTGKGRNISFLAPSIILIDVLEGFAEGQQFLEQLLPICLQLSRIHHLAVVLHPIQHQMFLNPMLRRIPALARHKLHHLPIPHHPQIIIFHCVVKYIHKSIYSFL